MLIVFCQLREDHSCIASWGRSCWTTCMRLCSYFRKPVCDCVVLRSSLTARAEFPWANAIMDGFGGADLTIPKLLSKRRS
ncbi:hypothetical protein FF1_004504 [Malus domestica]